jgi:uncharacterized membrane protein YhaH (DUF805 family)
VCCICLLYLSDIAAKVKIRQFSSSNFRKQNVMNSPNPYKPASVSNPYIAPRTVNSVGAEEYGDVNIFSIHGRLGRVRYIGFSVGLSILVLFVGSFLVGILAAVVRPQSNTGFMVITLMPWVLVFALQIYLTIQRCHDFDMSGWLSLAILIPLVGFIFWFIPGTNDANRWGNKNPPNSTGVIILACIVPVITVFLVGILAAIAIPQYQKYNEKAKAARANAEQAK